MTTTVLPRVTYLNVRTTVASWLLTKDHKRIGILYLGLVAFAFLLGGIFAAAVRIELTTPQGDLLSADSYNRMFTAHGVMMVFFVLIPVVPGILGNFVMPLMIGAKDVAFPRLNLLSWYLLVIGFLFTIAALVSGGVDTGWTFYTPYSSLASNSNVVMTGLGIFIAGFSSILTGLNFMVTIHRMRAPGMTWFRLPLFVWALYATALVQILGTPIIAITLLMLVLERVLGFGIFDPRLGGDPVLFQHLFWFYSHPAVYIMILPPMGVISEVITCFSRKNVFGYSFVAFSSLAIAVFGFLVWAHHLFVAGISQLDAAIRLLSTLRSLGPTVTILLICHVSNVSAQQQHGATKPYGSIYVQALGRSIWEARRDDDGGDDVVVSLFHRKCNVTRLHSPVSLRFQFSEEMISVTSAEPTVSRRFGPRPRPHPGSGVRRRR